MSNTEAEIDIRAAGDRNLQVTEPVKDCLYSWLEDRGIGDARETVVMWHRDGGDFVAVSNQGVSDVGAFNKAYSDAVDYWRNQAKTDDTFWISQYWIEEQLWEDFAED